MAIQKVSDPLLKDSPVRSINDLNDVDIATVTPESGQTLVWDGANFVPGTITSGPTSINDLSDVDIATDAPTNGQVLGWDGTNFVPIDPPTTGATSLDGLSDVDLTTNAPTNGQTLIWDGTNFVPGTIAAGSALTVYDEAAELSVTGNTLRFIGAGVTATEGAEGDITVTIPGATGGATSLNDLSDVDLVTNAPTNGQTLIWDGANFVPGTIEAGSALTVFDEATELSVAGNTLRFVGAGVTATEPGVDGDITITIPGSTGTAISVFDEANNLTTALNTIRFAGAAVTATEPGTDGDITVTIANSAVTVFDETTQHTSGLNVLRFLGAGVTATEPGAEGDITVTIPVGEAPTDGKQYVRISSAWAESVGNVPTGGQLNQVLRKKSATNYDMEWGEIAQLFALEGQLGNVIVNVASHRFDSANGTLGFVPQVGNWLVAILMKQSFSPAISGWTSVGGLSGSVSCEVMVKKVTNSTTDRSIVPVNYTGDLHCHFYELQASAIGNPIVPSEFIDISSNATQAGNGTWNIPNQASPTGGAIFIVANSWSPRTGAATIPTELTYRTGVGGSNSYSFVSRTQTKIVEGENASVALGSITYSGTTASGGGVVRIKNLKPGLTNISVPLINTGRDPKKFLGVSAAGNSLEWRYETIREDAPADGLPYVRKDNAWAAPETSTGFAGALLDLTADVVGYVKGAARTAIPFDTIVRDTHGLADIATGQFVIPKGVKRVKLSGQVKITGDDGDVVSMQKNGANFFGMPRTERDATAGADVYFIQSAVVDVAEGDTLKLFVYNSGELTDTISGANTTWFQIEIVEGAVIGSTGTGKVSPGYKGARLVKTAVQAITQSVWTTIVWDSADRNTNGFYSNVNNTRLTIPVGVSKVQLKGSIETNSTLANANIAARFKKNGSVVFNGNGISVIEGGNTACRQILTDVLDVVAGDYFDIEVYNGSGAMNVMNANGTWFSLEVKEGAILDTAISITAADFSTSEHLTGARWINGEPIYRKVVDCGVQGSVAGTKSVAHGISGFMYSISCGGFARDTGTGVVYPIPYVDTTLAAQVGCWVDGTNAHVKIGQSRTTWNVWLVIEYTKA